MKKIPLKVPVPAVLTAWLALTVVFAGVFVFEELEHECTGEHCCICLQIEIAIRLIEAFGRIGIIILVAGSTAAFAGIFVKTPAVFPFVPATPVSLKIKCNC
ncbi:MAG: hypothetical protein LBF77_01890 [Spirochaetaceae bacterium]|jgi:hypothetical protein|nr:hypothetical protein [Spirochaetaceae bacterium]